MQKQLPWRWKQLRQRTAAWQLTIQEAILPNQPLHTEHFEQVDPFLAGVFEQHTDQEQIDLERAWANGNQQQVERLRAVADYALAHYDGNIIEIGAHKGRMTRILADVAQQHNRRVMVVDPWETHLHYKVGDEYEVFLEAIDPYKAIVDILRLSSLDQAAIARMRAYPIAFAFVDGLHTYQACLSDIVSVQHCAGYIAVDDVIWSEPCRVATQRGAHLIKRRAVHHPRCREAYLLPIN